MQVVFDGFSLGTNEDTVKNILQAIKYKIDNKPEDERDKEINFIEKDNVIIGNIITYKDIKKIPKKDAITHKFSVIKLNPSEPIFDFNYFVIDLSEMIGVYMSYRGSLSINSFSYQIINTGYNIFEREKKSSIKKEKIKKTEIEKKIKHFSLKFPAPIFTQIASTESFIDKVRELEKVNSICHSVTMKNTPVFSAFAKDVRRLFVIDQKLRNCKLNAFKYIEDLIDPKKKVLDEELIGYLAVVGSNSEGKQWTYNYNKNYERYSKISFDDVVDMLEDKDISNLDNNLVAKMLEILNSN